MHQHLLMSEFEYWGVPGPDLTVTSVAPMIMRHGTERNKTDWLPLIASGEKPMFPVGLFPECAISAPPAGRRAGSPWPSSCDDLRRGGGRTAAAPSRWRGSPWTPRPT